MKIETNTVHAIRNKNHSRALRFAVGQIKQLAKFKRSEIIINNVTYGYLVY